MTRVVIADDHEVVRHGIRSILETASDLAVAGEASNGRQAVQMAAETAADIVIMDINMPELNGLEATRLIVKTLPHCQVLILTMHDSEQLVREVLQAGARGYLLKTDAGQELLRAVRALQSHQVYFTARISELLLSGFLDTSQRADTGPAARALTAREREIVQLLVEGNSNKEVAAVLGISVKTVETHRARIMEKLSLRSFSDLVRYAIRNNMAAA